MAMTTQMPGTPGRTVRTRAGRSAMTLALGLAAALAEVAIHRPHRPTRCRTAR
jgi:hypothetical protein